MTAAVCTGLAGYAVLRACIPRYEGDLDDYRASVRIFDRNGRLLRMTCGPDDTFCVPVFGAAKGAWLAPAVVAAEDKRFYRHDGVDRLALCRAMGQNLAAGRVVSGASTISTLVVKLTEPRPRTVWTKIVEAHHAGVLERSRTKEQILEQYLNRAPFGSNLRGIEAAAGRWFGKRAADLSLSEAALLVGLPQAPSALRPDRYPARARRRRDYVLDRMLACGFIADSEWRQARAAPAAVRPAANPFEAPHFCDLLLRRYGGRHVLRSTLDSRLQSVGETALRTRLREPGWAGIRGGAVVILDVESGAVRAMIGSPDFGDETKGGQVNGTMSRRSPGSALKPFVYALAMDLGLCTPGRVVADVPMSFPGYSPENFDRTYCGPVSAREALVHSLNIPALDYTQRVGQEAFVACLRRLGLSTLDQPAGHYGLGIVVGGCEVSLLELANAYGCLARGGVYRAARFLETEEAAPGARVFSAEAVYMITDMLGGDERVREAIGHTADTRAPRVAWKTGTSAGGRDAWTIAYNPDYVVGVWLGNPDGRPSPALVGGTAAAPVALDVFRRLYPDGPGPWFERPDGLQRRAVCARTGGLPNGTCPTLATDDYIPGVSASCMCDVHRRDGPAGSPVREVWPPAVHTFLRTHGMCETGVEQASAAGVTRPPSTAARLHIREPADGETFRLMNSDLCGRQGVRLVAVTDAPASDLHWFVDGERHATASAARPVFWAPRKGRHAISCCDNRGRSDRVTVTVE